MTENTWDISKSGPLITLMSEDIVITLMIAWRQDGGSSAIVSRWELDSDCSCELLKNGNWQSYWEAFLDRVPVDWAPGVAHCEWMVKY
jgi:hypothetical protein